MDAGAYHDSPAHELWQMDAAEHIEKNFDEGLTYENDNGNVAINRKVLDAFRAISDGTVVWERERRVGGCAPSSILRARGRSTDATGQTRSGHPGARGGAARSPGPRTRVLMVGDGPGCR